MPSLPTTAAPVVVAAPLRGPSSISTDALLHRLAGTGDLTRGLIGTGGFGVWAGSLIRGNQQGQIGTGTVWQGMAVSSSVYECGGFMDSGDISGSLTRTGTRWRSTQKRFSQSALHGAGAVTTDRRSHYRSCCSTSIHVHTSRHAQLHLHARSSMCPRSSA